MRLAVMLAVAYALAIVYASLQPFTGWRLPADSLFSFVFAWPRYITTSDIVVNVVAYFPLGGLLFRGLRPTWRSGTAATLAVLIGIGLSFAMESIQMFLPERIPTTLDLLSNSTGAFLGVLAGWSGQRLMRGARHYWLHDSLSAEVGVVVIIFWLVVQAHPAPFALGPGDLRQILELTPLMTYTPSNYAWAEAGVTALMAIAVGLLMQSLLAPQRRAWLPIICVLALGFAVKSLVSPSLMLATPSQQGITPGTLLGLVGGGLVLLLLTRMAMNGRLIMCSLCIVCSLLITNSAPQNPYQSLPAFLLSVPSSHFANFARLTHALSLIWPFITLIYLGWIMTTHRKPR